MVLAVSGSVSATYTGDRPLITAYSGEISGAYSFSTGNSSYSGTLHGGDAYSVEIPAGLPDGVSVEYSRLYVYWTWSRLEQKGAYPSLIATVLPDTSGPLVLKERYYDNKGFAGRNDYYTGMDVYEIAGLTGGDKSLTFIFTNSASDNRTIILQGAAVLTVYSTSQGGKTMIWVDEGADLLYSNYGITPEMATGRAEFSGEIPLSSVGSAHLLLVAPSGGYSQSAIAGKNGLYFNRGGEDAFPEYLRALLHALFPRYGGKFWTDVFAADEVNQIGIESREVAPYLHPAGNTVEVQDNGDYILFTNAVLSVNLTGDE